MHCGMENGCHTVFRLDWIYHPIYRSLSISECNVGRLCSFITRIRRNEADSIASSYCVKRKNEIRQGNALSNVTSYDNSRSCVECEKIKSVATAYVCCGDFDKRKRSVWDFSHLSAREKQRLSYDVYGTLVVSSDFDRRA